MLRFQSRLLLPIAVSLFFAQPAWAEQRFLSVKQEAALNEGLQPPPEGLDRSTPHASWQAFVDLCGKQTWEDAAHLFNLGDIPKADQASVGASIAQKACAVFGKLGQLQAQPLDKTRVGPSVDGRPLNYVVVGTVTVGAKKEEAWFRRTQNGATTPAVWIFTRFAVSSVSNWYDHIVLQRRAGNAIEMVNKGLGKIPTDYDTHSPRSTTNTFLALAKQGNYADAARLLDLRAYNPADQAATGARLARRLAILLARLRGSHKRALSNDPNGAPEKGVPSDQELLFSAKTGGESIDMLLIRLRRKDGVQLWAVSQRSVGAIDALYDVHGYGWAGDVLPPVFVNTSLWDVQLWQWIGLLIGIVAMFLFARFAGYITRKILLRLAKLTRWTWDDLMVEAARGPLILLYFALGLLLLFRLLSLSDVPQGIAWRVFKLVSIISVGWYAVRILDVAAKTLEDLFKERQDDMGMAMIPVARKIFKPVLIAIIGVVALQNIGINVTGLIAGLGIGGLALAMASKTTVENLLGGITIAFDRPFKVGDFVKVSGMTGSVEEVGLRSTRLRTVDRTIITIPNGQMVDSKIENFAARDRVRLQFTVGVQYDTSQDQLRLIIDQIKRVCLAHPDLYRDFLRVRFAGFGDSSMDIEIYVFVDTTDYHHFTAVREDLLLRIGEVVADAGAEFAFPSRTIYTGKAAAADGRKAKAAAAIVKERVDGGIFTIPEVPDQVREELQGGS